MVQMGGFTPPRLPHPVVHLPHVVDHLILSLPLGKELAFGGWNEDQNPLTRSEEAQLGPAVVGPSLGLLCLLKVFPDYGPHLSHFLPYLFDVVHQGTMGGGSALQLLFSQVQESPWPPSI